MKIVFYHLLLVLIISHTLLVACNHNSRCWELDKLNEYLVEKYSSNCEAYLQDDTLNYIIYTNKIGNSGQVDIIREEILYDSYILNSEKELCHSFFFFGVISKDSIMWALDSDIKDLYTIIFRNIYYPELHNTNLYMLDQMQGELLNAYDQVLASIEHRVKLAEKPQSFSKLAFLYIASRLKGIENGEYQQILKDLLQTTKSKHNDISSDEIMYILEYGKSIKGRYPEGEGLPWPKWDEDNDFIEQIQNFKDSMRIYGRN